MNIVSLLPSTTEIVFDLGLADQLRGVTVECNWPQHAKDGREIVVDTFTNPTMTPGEIDAIVKERVAQGLDLYNLDDAALARCAPDLILSQDLCRVCAVASGDVNAAIIALATQIKGAQDPEISQMKNLLTTWGMPTEMGSMDHSSMMDGMLSLEEMATLGQLKGAEFDKAWAKGMIAHHEGAIAMANDVLANGKNSEILALANAVASGQTAEIETLKPLAG